MLGGGGKRQQLDNVPVLRITRQHININEAPQSKGRGRWPVYHSSPGQQQGYLPPEPTRHGSHPKAQPSSPTLSSWLFFALLPTHRLREDPVKQRDFWPSSPFLRKMSKRKKYALNAGKNTQSIFKLFSPLPTCLYILFFGIDLPTELQLSSRSWQLLSNYISLKTL